MYCDESSLWVDTPACAVTISSTAFPVAEGAPFAKPGFNCCVAVVCLRCDFTMASPNDAVYSGKTTSKRTESFGSSSVCLRVSYPSIE